MSAVAARMPIAAETDVSRIRALVVDENAAARQATRDLLQSMGIGLVQQANDPIRAIRMMEAETFGLVLCETRFRSQMDGCQVLEYVRTRRLLAPWSAFVLLSSDAERSAVAAAREWQPDAFVLKPLTAATLTPRVDQALRRRRAFAPLHEAADRGDAEAVLQQAQRLARRGEGRSLEVLRWQAQALVDLGRWGEVRRLCGMALELRDGLPWAELALAHAERAEGRVDAACERLRATIRAHPFFGGAYDLLIDILQETGRTAKALAVAQAALEQIATSRRTRTLGEIAYAHGELDLAEKCYAELVRKTSASLTRSALDVGMLGQVFVGQGASEKALRLVTGPQSDAAADPPAQALVASVQSQAHAAMGDAAEAEVAARRALELVERETAPESVALLVARGAFGAGLHAEAQALVQRTVRRRRHGVGASALARRVLADAGIEPDAFVAAAVRDATDDAPPAVARPEAGDAPGTYMRADGRRGDGGDRGDATADPATPAATGDDGAPPVSAEIELALRCLHRARFDDALAHVERARARLPSNPMVLMATAHVHLLRMRARGFDADAAREVRRCLAEIDGQIPGEARVFRALADDATARRA